jgi:hypothetical protein
MIVLCHCQQQSPSTSLLKPNFYTLNFKRKCFQNHFQTKRIFKEKCFQNKIQFGLQMGKNLNYSLVKKLCMHAISGLIEKKIEKKD